MNPYQAIGVGAHVLTDWLGKGGNPVDRSVANLRSESCWHCPSNHKGDWTRFVSMPIALAILEQRRAKTHLKLLVNGEDRIHFCRVCKCYLPLAVWVPAEHYRKHVTKKMLSELPDWCWKRQELEPK